LFDDFGLVNVTAGERPQEQAVEARFSQPDRSSIRECLISKGSHSRVVKHGHLVDISKRGSQLAREAARRGILGA